MKCQNINNNFNNIYTKTTFKAKSFQPISKPAEELGKKQAKTLGPLLMSGLAALGLVSNKKNQNDTQQKQELSDKEFQNIKTKLLNSTKDRQLGSNIYNWLSKNNVEMYQWIVKNQYNGGKDLACYISNYGRSRLPLVEKVFYTPDIPHEHVAGILDYSDHKRNEVDTDIERYRKNRVKINELKPLIENYQVKDSKKPNKLSVIKYLNHPPYVHQNMEYITYEKLVDFIENNEHSNYDSDILFSPDEETFDLRMDFAKILKYHNIDDDFNILFSYLKKYNSDFLKKLIQVDNHNLTNVIMIAAYLKESNIEFFKKLCNDDRFYDWLKNDENDLIEELSEIDESNVDIVDELYECTKNINKDDFINLMRDIIKTNHTTVELCKAYGINPIIGAGNTINCNNAPVIKKIIDTKNYSDSEVRGFAQLCMDKQTCEFFDALGTDKRKFDAESILFIYNEIFIKDGLKQDIPKHKFEAIMQIIKSQKLSKLELKTTSVLLHNKPAEFMAKLCNDDNIPKDKIFEIFGCVISENLPAAKALVESKNISADDIITILGNTLNIEKEDIPFDLLETNILKENPGLVNYPLDSWRFCFDSNLDVKKFESIIEKNPLIALYLYENKSVYSEYAKTNNPNIVDIHIDLINDALKNKNILKPWNQDLSDEELIKILMEPNVIKALSKVGKGTLESVFPQNIYGVLDYCEEIAEMKLSDELNESLTLKIYPENSKQYKTLAKEIKNLKEEINDSLTLEETNKRKELSLKIVKYEQRLHNENSNKKAINQKIKQLKSEKQGILYNSKNNDKIRNLMKQIAEKQKEAKNIVGGKVNLSPQEIADKVQVVAQLPGVGVCDMEGFTIPSNVIIKSDEEVADYLFKIIIDVIDLIQPNTKENEEKWNEYINRLIYSYTDTGYTKELSDKLDLIKSKYISKIFTSNGEFFENFDKLLKEINLHPDLSIEETIDNMEQNLETQKLYNELGIDYDKWTKVDKNSFVAVSVKLDANEAKQAAIENLEEDLNDMFEMKIPEEEIDSLKKRLNDSGYKLTLGEKVIYDEDGFKTGTKEYMYLYKNDKPIEFEDLNKIINVIKEELNRNDFWSIGNEDEDIEKAREHLYHHLMKLRPAEFENAKNIKENETADIEVRKTDMYDIKKALGLGNDASCCTALGSNFNEWTAPNYIMNKCIGAIELTDRGNFAGNTMIYLANVDGELSLVLDNIEMKSKYQFNNEIRDAFFAYARKLCDEIGKPDMPIYAGPNRHKVDMKGFPIENKRMEIIGDTGDSEVYLDFDADAHEIHNGTAWTLDLYRIS